MADNAAASGGAPAQTAPAQGGNVRGMGRQGFAQLREQSQAQAQAAKEKANQQGQVAKEVAQERAAQGKAEMDRLSEENPQFRAAREATEAKAAQAKAEGERIAHENQAVLEQNKAAAQKAAAEMKEISTLPPEEQKRMIAQKAMAGKDAGAQLYAQNKEMIEKNKASAEADRREADRVAQEARAQAAVMGTQAVTAGTAAAHTAVNIARGEFEQRCAKVREQESKLNSAANEIEKREKQLSLLLQKSQPNWPKKICCIEPMVHHDILGDIPSERQSYVKKCYMNYYFTIFLLIMNFALALTMLLLANKHEDDGAGGTKEKKTDDDAAIQHMGVSVLYLVGIIFAFMVWYWPIYKACGTGSSGQYIMGFIGLGMAIGFDIFTAIGPTGYGGTGLIYAMEVNNNKGSSAFIPAIIMAILWIIQACIFIWMTFRLYQFYNEDKASLMKAKTEMFAKEISAALT